MQPSLAVPQRMQMPKKVTLITDGACIGNPGPGGWAYILRYGEHKKELYGSEPRTTNNRMELKGSDSGTQRFKRTVRRFGDDRL